MSSKQRILVGSPIKQNFNVLKEFLLSLKEVNKENIDLDYYFFDDNDDTQSSLLLSEFAKTENKVILSNSEENDVYLKSNFTHSWNEQLIWKIADLKNRIISHAIKHNYDYLFFIDSDIVLHPSTLHHLISCDKDIISEIFWTRWKPHYSEFPQVWMQDHYVLYSKHRDEKLTQEEGFIREAEFINQLRVPGVYEVGGLGACTLIKRTALEKGLNFNEIKNISFWGEDRHFCIRANALGIDLFVDTHYPAYHIYRDSDLDGIRAYKEKANERIIEHIQYKVAMVVKDGMQALGTYHYSLGYAKDWKEYFSDSLQSILHKEFEEEKNVYELEHIKVNAYVEHLVYQGYDQNNDRYYVSFSLHNYILKKGVRTEEHFNCHATVIQEANNYVIEYFSIDSQQPLEYYANHKVPDKITLSTVLREEKIEFLKEALVRNALYIDEAVFLNYGVPKHDLSIYMDMLSNIKVKVINIDSTRAISEILLRKTQWENVVETNPDWILTLDTDEIFDNSFNVEVHKLIQNTPYSSFCFGKIISGKENEYTDSSYWFASNHQLHPYLVKYDSNQLYEWSENQVWNRLPINIMEIGKSMGSTIIVKLLK